MKSVYDRNIIICDIDGTIANVQHRLHFIKNLDGTMKPYAERDWDSFNAACVDDEPYKDVIEILCNLYNAGRRKVVQAGTYGWGSERKIYFFSGRNEAVRNETIAWMYHHFLSHSMCHPVQITREQAEIWIALGVGYSLREERGGKILGPDGDGNEEGKYFFLEPNLFMRNEGDHRPDTVVKLEMLQALESHFSKDEVLCVLDDRQSVVDMWRENGLRVMQVDAWGEEGTPKYIDCTADGDLSEVEEAHTLQFFEEQAEQAFFEELDELRDSGEINMLGAPRWLVENYGLDKAEAKRIFMAWAEKKEEEG